MPAGGVRNGVARTAVVPLSLHKELRPNGDAAKRKISAAE